MTAKTGDIGTSKLPFWRTVGASYRFVFANGLAAVRYGWHWILLSLAAAFALNWLVWPSVSKIDAIANEGKTEFPGVTAWDWVLYALDSADTLLPMLFLVPLIVAWHRMVAMNVAFSEARIVQNHSVYWRYVIAVSILLLPVYLVLVPIAGTMFFVPNETDAVGWLAVAIFLLLVAAFLLLVAALFIVPRFAVYLTAIAAERTDASWMNTWRASRRNTWRLAMGDCLVALPVISLPLVVTGFELPEEQLASGLHTVLEMATSIVSALLEAGFFSLAYLHFLGDESHHPVAAEVPSP